MTETTIEKKVMTLEIKPKFLDPQTLSPEQLTDPDYRLKKIQKEYGIKYIIGCSRCHHCR